MTRLSDEVKKNVNFEQHKRRAAQGEEDYGNILGKLLGPLLNP